MHYTPVEVEERITQHSGQPELVDRNYEDHRASHRRTGILINLTKMRS